jgi:hypothetical protein
MKFIVSLLICPLLAYALGLMLPWWSVAIAGVLTGFFYSSTPSFSFSLLFFGKFNSVWVNDFFR